MRFFRTRVLCAFLLACPVGCVGLGTVAEEPVPFRVSAYAPGGESRLSYRDTEAFDALLETHLTSRLAQIIIDTGCPEPTWEGRLNLWLDAWNRAAADRPHRAGTSVRLTADSDAELPAVPAAGVNLLPAEAPTQARLLVADVLDRAERLAREIETRRRASAQQRRRLELLLPYQLQIEQGVSGTLLVVFRRR